MDSDNIIWAWFVEAVAKFCFGYPFVMSWYWITGSVLYWFIRERHQPVYSNPPELPYTPLVSVLLPCFNESDQELNSWMRMLRIKGALNFGYYPDDPYTNQPNIEVIRRELSSKAELH